VQPARQRALMQGLERGMTPPLLSTEANGG
jgi:hypothetical protein